MRSDAEMIETIKKLLPDPNKTDRNYFCIPVTRTLQGEKIEMKASKYLVPSEENSFKEVVFQKRYYEGSYFWDEGHIE